MKIFISHIQEEMPVALVLKKWVEAAFGDRCQVMVSSDPESLPAAARELEEDEQALSEIKALVLLCSPSSLQTPWLCFEAGCAWIRKIFIIPACCGGISPDSLPPPLGSFPGLDMNQKDFPQKLFFILARELGLSELPGIQYRQVRDELKAVLESIHPGSSTAVRVRRAEPGAPLEEIHIQIMLVLAAGQGYTLAVLSDHFHMNDKEINPLLERLIEANYVYATAPGMGHVRYNLTHGGKAYLEENNLL